MNPRLILIICLILALVGCAEPTIDASNEDALKRSIENVRDSLSASEQTEFDEAFQLLAMSQIDFSDLMAESQADTGLLERRMRDSVHGKTANEVIDEANRIREQRRERERQQALSEIQELQEKRRRAESAREELKSFEVLRSRFYFQERQFTGKEPIIEIDVRNGTSYAISRAYFEGTIASPNRSVPWHQDTFNYSISGGLEPGEEASWRLAPNMFSGWGRVDAPDDAVFTVTVERLDGPDGEPVLSTRDFGDRDARRLEELKRQYNIE